ncbi:MAG: hypothetical protein FJ267_05980, partial [Planctomycetes bacterium]|nr:hypothetical protein [Planctomycetota bacterium]
TVQERDQHHQQLRNIEGVGPNLILQVAAQLPPALDSQGVVSGESFRIRVTPEGHSPEIAYSVLLPNEYSPLKNYPMIVLLRSKGRTNEQLLRWWGGSSEHPGVGMNRGYVLIAPEYAEEKETEYSYRAEVHSVVIESLRDARRRFSIDSDRVFLAGHGMGADAAFDLGMAHPDEFAGVIPISGSCALHPRYTYENGKYTAWYVIGRGFSDDFKDTQNNAVFDEIFRRGPRFDFMLIEYLGRGMDGYQEEIPKIFDWMDLHRRISVPQEFEVATLRKSDNQYFWLSAVNLPRTITLSHSTKGRVNKMGIDGKITPGNRVVVRSAADKFVVRFPSGLIDFEKRVTVSINGRDKFKGFITPDIQSILEELRVTGDKTRLPLSTMEF